MDRVPGNKTKDERAPDMNTPGFEPGTQWSEVDSSTLYQAHCTGLCRCNQEVMFEGHYTSRDVQRV